MLLYLLSKIVLTLLHPEQHTRAVVVSSQYWWLYILLKHASEAAVLGLELAISTAIRVYDNAAVPARQGLAPSGASGSSGAGRSIGGLRGLSSATANSAAMNTATSATSAMHGGGSASDRTSIAYQKLPNYSSMEMSATPHKAGYPPTAAGSAFTTTATTTTTTNKPFVVDSKRGPNSLMSV